MAGKDIKTKLDELAQAQAAKDLALLKKQELIDQATPQEVKAAVADIELEFAPEIDAIDAAIESLTKEIKDEVAAHGESVKGSDLMAVWSKGRVSWDSKTLDAMAKLIPQIAEARKEGEPVVSIKRSAGNA